MIVEWTLKSSLLLSGEYNIIRVNASEGKRRATVQQRTVLCEINYDQRYFVDNELFVLTATVLSSNERKS